MTGRAPGGYLRATAVAGIARSERGMTGRHAVRIVLVEDAVPLLDLERSFLRRLEVDVVEAPEDPAIVDLVRRTRPSLAVLDVRAPVRAGLELCRRLKFETATRSVPVVLLAADTDAEDARDAGADAVVGKPVARTDFLDAVRGFVPLTERRAPRARINVRFSWDHAGRHGQAFSRELSGNGVLLRSDLDAAVGERLGLRFLLPGDDREIRCGGTVRRVVAGTPHGSASLGVEFDDVAPSDQRRLDRFVEHLAGSGR